MQECERTAKIPVSDLFGMLESLHKQASRLSEEAVLVTIVAKTGSSYRQAGAHLLVFPDGQWHGMLSGGCIEDEVARMAVGVFSSRQFSSLEIDTDRWMGCRGTLKLQLHLVGALLQEILHIGQQRIFGQWLNTYPHETLCTTSADPAALLSQPLLPPIRLVVIGAGPDCFPIIELSRAMSWETDWICHPEQRNSSSLNLAQEKPRRVHPQSSAAQIKPDSRTAVIVMNHHFGRDSAYLESLWSSELAYLSLLGSRERANNILEQLFQRGLDPDRAFHSPAGIALGGDGAQAVALSVVSQVQQVLNAG
jgi:xanthine dehydrogenase accessory factor